MRFAVPAVIVGVLGAAWLGVHPGRADDTSPGEALTVARELVAQVSGSGLVDDMVSKSWPTLLPQVKRSMPDASAEELDEMRADYVRIVSEHAQTLIDATPKVFAKYFTVPEMRDMIAFYRSPTGRKAIELMPMVVGDSVAVSTARIAEVNAEIDAAFRRALKDKGVDL